MNFLNPLLLAGLGALAVPILIHLLNRRRGRRVVWAAMRFLQASLARHQRRLNLEDWLLLTLRCLLLALLALALARPTFQNSALLQRNRTAVTGIILLDNSYSLGLTDGVQSRFAHAKQYAETILDALPVNSATAVWLAADVVQGLIPEPTRDLNLARKTLRTAPLSDRGTRLVPAVRAAVAALRRRGGARREIYLLTDGQAGGWEEIHDAVQLLTDAQSEIHLNLILLTDADQPNLGISDFRLASGLTPVEQPVRFDVQVTNYGHTEARAVAVRLTVDNEPPADQTVIDSLAAGMTTRVALFTKFRTAGPHAVTALITGDRLPADDRRTLAVEATRRFRVLLVDGHPSRDAVASETFYLRNALAPVDLTMAANFYIEPVLVTPAEFATTRLDNYAGVVLANVADFSQATATALDQYVRRGGGLIIFPGNLCNPRFYNDELAGRYALLPATLSAVTTAGDGDQAFHLQPPRYAHPLVTLWNDPAAGTLTSARFLKAWRLQPADTNTAHVVIRFDDGTPAIVERAVGQGRVVLFASTANTAWNDLPARPAFVPLLSRTLGALLEQRHKAFNIAVGDRFVYRTTEAALGKEVRITHGDQWQQSPGIELVDDQPVLTSDPIELAGAYDVLIATDPPLHLQFAAQADARESQLDALTDAQLDPLSSVATVVHWQRDTAWKQTADGHPGDWEIWRVLAWLALGVAVIELTVGQLCSEPK